jgi:hypothetical protein
MENVTEELVRQNGNQAAAVMADYAGQGGGGGSTGISVAEPVSAPVFRQPTSEDLAKFSKGDAAVVMVAEINGIVPLTIVRAASPIDVVVMHLYGIGYMGERQDRNQLKALYKVSNPTTSDPSITNVVYQISDDGSLLGEEGLM